MALTAKQKRDQALREEGAAQARAEMESRQNNPDADIRGGISRSIAEANLAAATHPDQVASAQGDVLKPQHAGEKVIVGCKLGIAYYDIQLCKKKDDVFEQNMQGGRLITQWERTGGVVRLRGTAYPRGTPPAGYPERPEIADGAALNRGISRDFMVEWLEQHRNDPMVVNNLIFIAGSDDEARGLARDFAGFKSGLDPINPTDKSDPRIPRSTREEVEDVKPGDRGKAA